MNRIVLIGNGFDLAHGLKTSYADFINWYWRNRGNSLLKEHTNNLSDELCSFTLKETPYYSTWHQLWASNYNPLKPCNGNDVVNLVKENKTLCDFKYRSSFFEQINKSIETNSWVDIENHYYNLLKQIVSFHNDAKKINDNLDFIKEKLIEYLLSEQDKISEKLINNKLRNKITDFFKPSDISVEGMRDMDIRRQCIQSKSDNTKADIHQILLLNFNYTNLADLYLPSTKNNMTLHIHGELSKPKSVIFGYGDELDEDYKTISEKKENEYLRNIKSIHYLESDQYRKVLEFIEYEPFQIYIMGHSCGNSDRTLLNTLFEHRNCVSIKPYYYLKDNGEDNYLELVQNISRNFTDMKLFRDRVVNKEYCETLT